ncbi:Ubiquitin carboxyl-terminal hydrolase [Penicillium ucsense]|uniref:Ubiquitin carboxyl-terminal hydrolase n=1 Tax=Penicillium ucsense TaxID=2839758 RepID=A0A8J8W9Y9_9EURO|nr:Ubiquitin carboxyl-terminal hydrolase [Penicillium ucsense]KAF7732694.1 Ubiquitin carboxyl-terminal hydrolase [Penicillium ucsense]
MAQPPPASSSTPPDAPLNDSMRPLNESMEDSNPERKQKRPRLDSGSGLSPSISRNLDGASATIAAATPSVLPAPVTSAALADKMDTSPDQTRPAKVTINVKSPLSDKSPSPDTDTETTMRGTPPISEIISARPDPSELHTTPSDVISISSSPAQSPVILAEDPEDMDENWRPLEEAIQDDDVVQLRGLIPTLVESFPQVRENASPLENMHRIVAMIQKGDPRDVDALSAVKIWTDDCVKHLDDLGLQEFGEAQEFWQVFPDVAECVLRRVHGLFIEDGTGSSPWLCLEQFFLNYVQIALHVTRLDTRLLEHYLEDPELPVQEGICKDYLQTLTSVFSWIKTPFYRALARKNPANTREMLLHIRSKSLELPMATAQVLSEWSALALEVIPRNPSLVGVLLQVLAIANTLVDGHLERNRDTGVEGSDAQLPQTTPLRTLYDMVRLVDVKYQDWITKKAAFATSDLSEQFLRAISHHYKQHCARDIDFVQQLSEDLAIALPEEASLADKSLIIFWMWKFAVLEKHITEGRMELRVHGVETMQSDLVHVWGTSIQSNPDGMNLPFVKRLVQFILDHKIVDYLVGVDSHPQLISRSSNIVGFLIVTDTYTNSVTDLIWRTVTESQDTRIVSEVLTMLIRTFAMHVVSAPALLHICQKLLELPLSRFDGSMLEFCNKLLDRMCHGSADSRPSLESVNPIPLNLCVRLVRDSTPSEEISVDQKKILQKFGFQKLIGFVAAGISEADRVTIYERCVQDIAEKNEFTAGSYQILNGLVANHEGQEMLKLAAEFDLTGLVIEDMLSAVNRKNDKVASSTSQLELLSRLSILFRLINMVPDTITPELGMTLWKDIFLSDKYGAEGRHAMWNMLTTALSQSTQTNSFLNRCIHEYLPALAPKDLTLETLAFAKQAIIYQVRWNPPAPADEGQVVVIPGMEQIWTFILNALPGTVEVQATEFAVQVYLDHAIISKSPKSAVEATHIALVERCLDQLKAAVLSLKAASDANGDSSMDSDTETGELNSDELRFKRSLCFLHQLLCGLRARPRYSSPRCSPPLVPEQPIKGEALSISWQSFNGTNSSRVQQLAIGDLSTGSELSERLAALTGFSKFTVIAGGQRLDLVNDAESTLRDIKAIQAGLLLVKKAPDAKESPRLALGGLPLTSVDSEVLKHFDELYDLLTLNDDLAKDIYEFLITFPPQMRVRNLIKSGDSTASELFPLETPFVAFYSCSTLARCLLEEGMEETPNPAFVSRSIKLLVSFLIDNKLSDLNALKRNQIYLASAAVGCLLESITISSEVGDEYRVPEADKAALAKRLQHFVEAGRSLADAKSYDMVKVQKLICNSWGVLLEGSFRDPLFWNAVKQEVQLAALIQGLLLEEPGQSIRAEISERTRRVCSPKGKTKPVKENGSKKQPMTNPDSPTNIDMLASIWDAFLQSFNIACKYAAHSAEFFTVALWAFRAVVDRSPQDVILSEYMSQWSQVMLSHDTTEFIGREPLDHLVFGMASLLEQCLQYADSTGLNLEALDIAEPIMGKYLLPELANETDDVIVPRTPLMHTETRQKLYNIIGLLCKQNVENIARTMQYLDGLIPRDESYNPTWSQDRNKMIRAYEGYAGLKNLSNTCYLNSLMTQLFMNTEFRKFMLSLNVLEPDESQKLLGETQRLFAWMQDTWMKSVNPDGFVESIRTYDNEAIDVTVQMDVDEFYNLLFDRWEAQVMNPDDKKRFRSFYGGQLVQQIKSKECSHISEREEPFSAIQCDIKGKGSLDESLQAYVEGEIMQGDNKYFCSGCGQHVDAVKRACLKEVPDNLIFHLKRFDFDMVTMMRSKINDEFRFPEKIDMTPYKVEHLSDPDAGIEPDVFELVGVLVHTGTAESGHYYSYTRERSGSVGTPRWVEFNDADVSRFDPANIADHCFGGDTHGGGGVQMNKVWNAYMLFYQRVNPEQQAKEEPQVVMPEYPARVPLPTALANHIAMENEIFIRTYCLLEPSYLKLVPELLSSMRRMDIAPEQRHQLQLMGTEIGLDTLEQLIARTKEMAGLFKMYEELSLLVQNPRGALCALEWFSNRPTSMRNVMLRSFHYEVRQKVVSIILIAIRCLKLSLETPDLDEKERQVRQNRLEGAVESIVAMLVDLWQAVQTVPRAWDEYFDFLVKLTEVSEEATKAVLANGMLVRCLEIIWLDPEDRKNLRGRYQGYCRLLEKGRQFPYRNLMALCVALLQRVDFALPPTPSNTPRTTSVDGRVSLTLAENRFIKPLEFHKGTDNSAVLVFLMKVLQHDYISYYSEAAQAIVASFLACEPETGFFPHILKTLEVGLRFSPAEHCVPFLDCAVMFCKCAPDEGAILALIDFVAKGLVSLNSCAGNEHLEFFIQLCTASNERLGLDTDWFTVAVQDRIPDFVPPLLIYNHPNVRRRTTEVLQGILFLDCSDGVPAEIQARIANIARELTDACVRCVSSVFFEAQIRNVESRIVQPIVATITHCLENYFDESDEDDRQVIQSANATLLRLQELTIEVPDDLVSESDFASPEEWEATSALASDSDIGVAGSP